MSTVGLNGADVLLYVGAEPLAGQRGATRSQDAATIDVSHKLDKYERFIPGRLSSQLQFDGLWVPDDTAYQALQTARENQDTVVCRLMFDGAPWREADGFITTMTESYPDQDAATISATFQVSGAWRDISSGS
jgi:predicted secreted protein